MHQDDHQSRHAAAIADIASKNESRRVSHLPVALALRDPQRAQSLTSSPP